MKRAYIFGIVGLVIAAMLVVGIITLAVVVSPVRAQIGRALTQVLNRQPIALTQTQSVQLKDEKGILVAGVITDSPADKAGLVRGDILLKVNGKDVNTRADLNSVLTTHKSGDALQVVVQHGDSQKTVSVTLADVPAQPQVTGTPQAGQPNNNQTPKRAQAAGVYLGILPIGAGEMRGEKGMVPGNGVAKPAGQIVQVAAGSPAEKAGLKVGEVITAVDGTQIDAQNSLSALISSHKPGDSVKLSVTGTDGTSRDVTVTLGDNPQKAGSAYLGVAIGRGGRGFNMGPNGNGLPFGHPDVGPGLAGHPGALIEQVVTGSPAEKAGLKSGELIVSIDGTTLSGPQALTDAVNGHKVGDQVTLSVFNPQTSQTSDVKVTLGDNPQKAGSAWMGISYTYIDMQQQQPGIPNPNGLPQPGGSGSQF